MDQIDGCRGLMSDVIKCEMNNGSSLKNDLEALKDSFPICLSFFFVFSAIGAISRNVQIGILSAGTMSFVIHAAPLQSILLVILKNKDYGFWMCIIISFFVNFRFLILSFALKKHFKDTQLIKIVFIIFLLNTSVFTVCHAKFKNTTINNKVRYFIVLAMPTMIVSVLATTFGYAFFNPSNAFISIIVSMMLPIHFAGITSKSLDKPNFVVATLIGFLFYPIFNMYTGIYSFVLCPALFAFLFTTLHTIKGKKNVFSASN